MDPLFPFGHGLSYTTFELSNLELSTHQKEEEEEGAEGKNILHVQCTLRNTGPRAGSEVIQVYIAPISPPIKRPVKELKELAKYFLDAGSERIVSIDLDLVRATSFWDENCGRWCSFAGGYEVLVGTSSRGEVLKSVVEIKETVFLDGC
jgi:beta-glucosidase